MNQLNLGIVNFALGDVEKALKCLEEAAKLSQENEEKHWEACSRLWLGKILPRVEVARNAEG